MSGRNLWTYFINITLIAQAIVPDEEVRSTSLKFGQRPRQSNRKCFAVINLVVSTILLLLLYVIVVEFEPDDAQKISEGLVSCQFMLLFLLSFAFSTCAGSIVQRTLWVFRPAMAAMGRENNCCRQALGRVRKGTHNIPQCSSWILDCER